MLGILDVARGILAYLEVYILYWPRENKEKTRNTNLNTDRRHSCRESNRVRPEYKSRALTLHEPTYVYENLIWDCATRLPAQLGAGPLT